jgi:hypothetical protein
VKKLIWLVLVLVTIFIFSACGSNNNDRINNTGQMEPPSTGQTETPRADSEQVDHAQVKFPENYEKGVLYSTINRGNIREPLYTSREAIEAAKNGKPLPDGTVITLVIYKDGKLDETLVSEKRSDWGDQTSSEKQNGNWRYQAFNPDKSINKQRNIPSCISCHASQERDDFRFTLDRMSSFELKDFTTSKDNNTKKSVESITLEEAHTLSEHIAKLALEK